MKSPPSIGMAVLALLVSMTSIQGGAALAKQLFPVIGAEGTTALRLLVATIILVAIWRPWRHPPPRQAWRSLGIYGLSLGFTNLMFYLSLKTIPLGLAVAIEFIGPLSIALLGSRRAADFLWVGLAVLGIVLLMPGISPDAPLDPQGLIYALAAALGWAIYILAGQKAGGHLHGGTATALGMAIGTLVALPVGLIHAGTAIFAWQLLPLAIGVGIFSSALPYSLEMVGLQRLPKQTFSLLMSLEPAIGSLIGLGFLGEHLSATQGIAIACVVIASAGSALSLRSPPVAEMMAG